MTDKYKSILLNYFTGNLKEEQGNNVPIFDLAKLDLTRNVKENIASKINSTPYITGKCYSELYSMFLVYGTYYDGEQIQTNIKSFIYIVDKNLNEVAFITKFASGSDLYKFASIQIDENNNFYGVSYEFNNNTGYNMPSRVVLLNNIFASGLKTGQYQVILKKTYIIPNVSSYSIHITKNAIIKDKNESIYYIVAGDVADLSNSKTKIVRFKINVGSSNEWDIFTFPYYITGTNFSVLFSKQNDNTIITYCGLTNKGNYSQNASYMEISISNDNVNLDKEISLNSKNLVVDKSQVVIKDINNIYLSIVLYGTTGTTEHKTIIYKVNGSLLTNIWEKNWVYYVLPGYPLNYWDIIVHFELIENIVFCLIYESTGQYADYSVGILKDTILYTYYDNRSNNYIFNLGDENDFYITKQYNLVNIFIPHYTADDDKTDKLIMDYNDNNYNGNYYENINSLVPKKCRFFNTSNYLIFARNLYNKIINNNTTVSTFEIPNTLLNDETIARQYLLSETNIATNENIQNITKNIYETLDINFFNTIQILNNNDIDNPFYNTIGATRVNNSVSEVIDYENTQAKKIRINYTDNTTKIQNIIWSPIRNYFMVVFALYVEKEIDSIDIISNDENTIYCTIKDNFVVGNIYKINQDVYIDYKIPTEQVLYNTDEVYYNNEPVLY
jgi:hypothetical protein